MAAKVQFYRKAWWVMTHHAGKRKRKRVGPTKVHKREAEAIAQKVNAAIALGTFVTTIRPQSLPCDEQHSI